MLYVLEDNGPPSNILIFKTTEDSQEDVNNSCELHLMFFQLLRREFRLNVAMKCGYKIRLEFSHDCFSCEPLEETSRI